MGLYNLQKEVYMTCHDRITRKGRSSAGVVWLLAVIAIILSGIAYRVLASRLHIMVDIPVKLPNPLSAFPSRIGNWTGQDVPIPANIQRIAGNDDFINRLYTDSLTNNWANAYIAYCANPRNMVGHKPEVCYVGGGWIHDSTESSEVISSSGMKIPCLIHRFHTPSPNYAERVVLNFYVLNGQLTIDESNFSSFGWRTPNIGGNPARYVAQVQISSILENSTRTFAADMVDMILDFFPDENGMVKAAKSIQNP